MKTYRLTYVGIFLGFLGMAFSVYRYLVTYYDPSQLVTFFVISGINVWVFAYVYNALRHLGEKMDERIEDLKKDVEANHKYLNDVIEPKLIKLNIEKENDKNTGKCNRG